MLFLVVGTSAVNLRNLQKRTQVQRVPLNFHQIPASFQEASYPDEKFHSWDSKQSAANSVMAAPSNPGHREIITEFNQLNFLDSGYKFEPEYESESSSLLETSVQASITADASQEIEHPQLAKYQGDFHRDSKYTIGVVPSSYREAIYWDSPADSFFEMGAETSGSLHNVLVPEDLPTAFIEAGYDDDSFFQQRKGPDYAKDHKFTIGIVPNSYKEALYWDSPASAFFEMSEDPANAGEDFKISPKGRTEDVNDPDYEINHPTPHKHSKNVIGTKQEGHLFWTDTVQPNGDTYESTFDERQRSSVTDDIDDQAFTNPSEKNDMDEEGEQLICEGCDTSTGAAPY